MACCRAWCWPRWPGRRCWLGAVGGAVVAAVLVTLAARDPRVGPDTGTAVAVTGLVGLGSLLALAPDAPQRLEELLFGDPLGVTDGDLVAAALLLVAGGAALVALQRPLAAAVFDAAGAAALGLRPGARAPGAARAARRGDRGRRPGPRRAARARGAGGAGGGGTPPRAQPGRGDARRGCRGRARRGGRDPAVRARRPRGRRLGCARALCRRRAGGRYAVAGWGAFQRAATIAPPRASITRLSSCGWVSPATTESLRRISSTRKRSTPARIR